MIYIYCITDIGSRIYFMWQHKRIFLMVAVYSRDRTVSLDCFHVRSYN